MPKKNFLKCQVSDEGIDAGKRILVVHLRLISSDLLLADSLSEVGAYPTLASFLKTHLTPVLKQYVNGARDFVDRAASESKGGEKQVTTGR